MYNNDDTNKVIVSHAFDNYWRKQLALSDSIKVSVNEDCSADKYNINITVSVNREDIVNDNLSDVLGIIKNNIELRLAELI